MAVIGGMTALDESVLRNMGDEALGILTTSWYSAELDNPLNKAFAPAFRKQFKYDPGFYAAGTYVGGAVLEAALKATGGKVEDKKAFMAAIRGSKPTPCAAWSNSTNSAMRSATSISAR